MPYDRITHELGKRGEVLAIDAKNVAIKSFKNVKNVKRPNTLGTQTQSTRI